VSDNIAEKLAAQLVVCEDEKKALRAEIERLKAQMAEMERRHKIALDKAYENGLRDAR
jgi:dynactin complex subunit